MNNSHVVTLSLLAFALACGGNEQPASENEDSGIPAASTVANAESPDEPAPSGSVDQELANQGATLFQTKGCIGCHTIGEGRLTGPDLQGVTDRRTRTWMIAMIVNPDSMLKNDDTARQLFAEYMTPMLNMNVTRDDAIALYEYLKRDGT